MSYEEKLLSLENGEIIELDRTLFIDAVVKVAVFKKDNIYYMRFDYNNGGYGIIEDDYENVKENILKSTKK